jgi:hypothetical protein
MPTARICRKWQFDVLFYARWCLDYECNVKVALTCMLLLEKSPPFKPPLLHLCFIL